MLTRLDLCPNFVHREFKNTFTIWHFTGIFSHYLQVTKWHLLSAHQLGNFNKFHVVNNAQYKLITLYASRYCVIPNLWISQSQGSPEALGSQQPHKHSRLFLLLCIQKQGCYRQPLVTQICRDEVSCRLHIPYSHQTEQLQDKKIFHMALQDDTNEQRMVPLMVL